VDLPTGIRNFTYAQDMAVFRTKTHWALFAIFLAILLAVPLYIEYLPQGNYWLSIINLICITIVAATGLNILTGYCGQLSIGHAGFMAVGAYTSAILNSRLGVPFPLALILAGLTAGFIGMIFGIPSLRVKGFYLAISTIAAQLIILWVIKNWTDITGGFNGMSVPHMSIGSLQLRTESAQFYFIITITILTLYFAVNLARTRVGKAFIAIRDNDLAAEVMGINPFRYKLLAFFIGCFIAGVAGCLMAYRARYVSAESFTFSVSILYIAIIIIGGLGTTLGPILGAIFIRVLEVIINKNISPALQDTFPQLPSGFTAGIAPLLFGLAIILFLIFEPRGLAHRWQLIKSAYRLWPFSY
jgi:branched-chain amino acid transport system permease protein